MIELVKKITLTGSSGFVGSNLVNYFNQNKDYQVKSINLRYDDAAKVQFDTGSCVIHLAGKAHDLKSSSNAQEYFKVNTELTKIIFDVFMQSRATTFVYFSSVKASADTVDGILYENIVPNPQTPYGQSKQQAEEYLLAQNLPEGKRLFILRPCMIHGPGNKGNLNLLYKFVKKGIPYPLAAFENQRSFLSINNLIFIMEKLISDTSIPGGVYNVADDEPLSTNEVINIIAKASGLKPKLWKLNRKLIETFAFIGEKIHLPLNTERLKKLTESYVVSNYKIKNALHINHLPTSSTEGLIATIKSFST